MQQTDKTLTLAFRDSFPDGEWAGGSKELQANGQTQWLIGRHPKIRDIRLSDRMFSRIHATVRYRPQTDQWQILDGGLYAENDYHSSTNGVWINGRRLVSGRWAPLQIGDHISLGRDPDARVVVRATLNDTIRSDEWEGDGWPALAPPPEPFPTDPPQPLAPPPATGPFGLAADLLDWLQESPKTAAEAGWKVTVVLLVLVLTAAGVLLAAQLAESSPTDEVPHESSY